MWICPVQGSLWDREDLLSWSWKHVSYFVWVFYVALIEHVVFLLNYVWHVPGQMKEAICDMYAILAVYDVTPYVEEHPGGDAILAHPGDDSTEGFFGPQHATRLFDMIDIFYLGELEN
ncbi:cytochrome B5-like protein [Artemisia annua]|uniref:Cytochrome B5-like protein n=1 Tax=Artemisia annua TaxID=35608 RepID=A0A2U1KIJ9_ARTAN|nr:cytochrome B5-like protein [Artemisia annua]